MVKWQVYKRVINKTVLITIVTVFIYLKGNSQFIITQQPTVNDYFFSLLPQSKQNQFQFIVIRDRDRTSFPIKSHQILTYD